MQIISVGTEYTQYACAQQGSRRVLSEPSLLHWAESNLPFFEYLLWECSWCWWSPPIYMERWVYLWLAVAMPELRLQPSNPPAAMAFLIAQWLLTHPFVNYQGDVTHVLIEISESALQTHSPLSMSARCPFEASLCLGWLKILSCYTFQGQ